MQKIGLCMIIKPTDEESIILDRCLKTVRPYVDKAYITITGKNQKCTDIANFYNCTISYFDWTGSFAEARAYNFSQATDVDYILWLDADDELVGGKNLKEVIESMDARGVKGAYAQYLYDFDEHGNVTVQHPKLRLIRNDGSFEWHHGLGELHEDLQPTYNVATAILSKGEESCYIEVHHKTTPERVASNARRNLEIASKQIEKYPDDPRAIWNYANSLVGVGESAKAILQYERFNDLSGSDDERYLSMHRLAALYRIDRNFEKAMQYDFEAIKLFPWYPDSWIGIGHTFYKMEKWKHAKDFLIQGMSKDPSEYMIVQNPRDYDQNPMMLLANCYFNMGKVEECRRVLEKLVEMFPKREDTKKMLEIVAKADEENKSVDTLIEKSSTLNDIELALELESLQEKLKSHPKICILRNERFKRGNTPGNEIAIYCGFTEERWNRASEITGIGGSEEAVLNLSRRWQKAGYQVVIYNNCGGKVVADEYGVVWKPYWTFNPRDKYDYLILWRSPVLCDRKLDALKVFVDMHDVVDPREFTTTRIANLDKVFVKSAYHRSLFPNIPDNKIYIIGNGIDLSQFDGAEKRIPKSMIYTSSPDRGLEHLLDAWPEIIKEHPDASLNIYYGWGVFDSVHKTDPVMMTWKEAMIEKMKQSGITTHGRVGHKEIARRMMQTDIYAYPCHFEEIFCISAVKAQAAGCEVIATEYAALPEVVKRGILVPGDVKGKEIWKDYIDVLLYRLGSIDKERKQNIKEYSWDNIAKLWTHNFE